jgi:hypothetical protein
VIRRDSLREACLANHSKRQNRSNLQVGTPAEVRAALISMVKDAKSKLG